jgi:hypothetical protein
MREVVSPVKRMYRSRFNEMVNPGNVFAEHKDALVGRSRPQSPSPLRVSSPVGMSIYLCMLSIDLYGVR